MADYYSLLDAKQQLENEMTDRQMLLVSILTGQCRYESFLAEKEVKEFLENAIENLRNTLERLEAQSWCDCCRKVAVREMFRIRVAKYGEKLSSINLMMEKVIVRLECADCWRKHDPQQHEPLRVAVEEVSQPKPERMVATKDEIVRAIEMLSPSQWQRLQKFADWLGRTGEDCFQEALLRTLDGRKKWNMAAVDFFGHLRFAIKGIAFGWKQKVDKRKPLEVDNVIYNAEGDEISRVEIAPSCDPSAHQCISAKDEVERLFGKFREDREATAILQAQREGEATAREIMQEHKLTKRQYEAARRRIRSQKSALIIEEDDHVLELMVRWLKAMDFAVVTASANSEGLRIYRERCPFDVVIVSCSLDPNGVEFAMDIHKRNPSQKIIITTTYCCEEDVARPSELAHVPILLKPFGRAELRTILESFANTLEQKPANCFRPERRSATGTKRSRKPVRSKSRFGRTIGVLIAAKARRCLRAAIPILSKDLLPDEYHAVKVCEAKFHAKAGNWQAADRAWSDAIASSRFSLTSSFTEAGRKREIQIQSEAFFDDASCRLRLGKRKQALLRVEQGKARLLADALSFSVADAKLPGNALAEVTKTTRRIRELEHILRRENISAKVYWDSSAELRESRLRLDKLRHTHGLSESPFASSRNSFRDIQRAVPAGGALVSFLFSSYGSAAFIIKDGQREIRSDNVVVFTERAHNSLKEVRELWTKVQFKEPRRSEKEVLEAVKSGAGGFSIIQPDEFTLLTVSWLLWDVVGPIIERLRHLGVEEGDQILFLPQEGLGLFPLHAAKPLDGPSVVDEFAICYAPSAYVQSVGVQNGVTRQHGEASLLVISDPTRDLRFASAEGELICSKMAGGVFEVLRQGDATRENVTSRCLRKKYLHFSCHGFYNPQEPMKSGLVLSGGIILTAEEILRSMDMSSCRLVVLSACDTGVAESNVLPNEYVGLTAAFLMAGVPAVISSLWQVDDIATMFLMGCFYENIFSALLTPVEALRRATTWLRNVKFRMLRDLCESEAKRLEKLRNPQSALFEELSKSYLNKPDQENKPFDDEYYWALFVINGS